MILYALTCDEGHGFESWFPDSSSYAAQVRRGLVTCPVCGSVKVEKAIMSPNIARKDRKATTTSADSEMGIVPKPAASPGPTPVALLGEEARALRNLVKAFRQHVTENADDVGKGFAEEALKIHHGEVEQRAIFGEATLDDARMLTEEGVAFSPLPILPEDRN
jgi:hypothetical protein